MGCCVTQTPMEQNKVKSNYGNRLDSAFPPEKAQVKVELEVDSHTLQTANTEATAQREGENSESYKPQEGENSASDKPQDDGMGSVESPIKMEEQS